MEAEKMSQEIWKPFVFMGNHKVGVINSAKAWAWLVIEYEKRDRTLEDLKSAKMGPRTADKLPTFGFEKECKSEMTLADWAEQNEMNLDF